MFSEQRHSYIMELIQNNGSVNVSELTEALKVSEATIRRDLNELEIRGFLKRTHGGAVKADNSRFELDYSDQFILNVEEKEHIAKIVSQMVQEGESVFLDSGTTTEKISHALSNLNITIITNSATIPSNNGTYTPEVYKIGGFYRQNTKSIVGAEAEKTVLSMHPDKAFIGANGVSFESVSTPHIHEAGIKEAILKSAKEKYLVVDHSKFNQEHLIEFALINQFDGIITDNNVSDEIVEYYESLGVKVIK